MCGTAEGGLAADEDNVAVLVEYLKLVSGKTISRDSRDWDERLATADEAVDRECRLMYALHRRLALTASGRLVLGSKQMSADDKVVMLRGGRAPYLLRACGEEYRFIGEAYVHGLMLADGDSAIKRRFASGDEEQISIVR